MARLMLKSKQLQSQIYFIYPGSFMKTLFKATILSATLATLSATANANLLVNGSFENPDVQTGSWQYFNSSSVPGWDGSNIEIWDHLNGEAAYEGSQFAELNAHPSSVQGFTIYQNFSTIIGQTYDFSFAYQARNAISPNESFSVQINGILQDLLNTHTTTGWSVYSNSFTAIDTTSTISFSSITEGTQGNFIDDVKVTTQVAEPATLALLGLGLAGLGFSRRRMKNA
jgi:hypothetical protein